MFVFLYGSIRFVLEFVKVVPDFAFGLTWGQLWGIPMAVLGGFMLLRLGKVLKGGSGKQRQ